VFLEGELVESFPEGNVRSLLIQTTQFAVVTRLVVVDQEGVAAKGKNSFIQRDDVHAAELDGGSVILSVEGGKARAVGVVVQNAMMFAQIDGVDLVAFHQICKTNFHCEASTCDSRSLQDCQDILF